MKIEELNEKDYNHYFWKTPSPRRKGNICTMKTVLLCGLAAVLCVSSYYFGSEANNYRVGSLEKQLEYVKSVLSVETEREKRNILETSHKEVLHDIVKRSNDKEPLTPSGLGGVTYVRWGRRNCPGNTQTNLVYEGVAAGSHYSHYGGGTQLLCLDHNITYREGTYVNGNQGSSYIYGVEYRDGAWADGLFDLSLIEEGNFRNHDVPCAVCIGYGRVNQLMIPGRDSCPAIWTKEYTGYIMASAHGHKHSTEYLCVDDRPQVVPGSGGDQGGVLLYLAETQCPSLQCEPFVLGREIKCVVCTI
ncbi:uncharacterized protein LOC143459406 [Clavelina lepadiformis]|uniref:uncharacterized protein LOC143459406 n=1 Tax=Clavelina lepadiformis TaxID=159417 RepID=UPI0040418B78